MNLLLAGILRVTPRDKKDMNNTRIFSRRRVWMLLALALFAVLAVWLLPGTALAEEAAKGAERAPQSTVMWLIESSGFIGAVILMLLIYFGSVTIQQFVQLRIQIAMPPEVVANCEAMLEAKDFKGIYEQVKNDDSFFSRVLNTGIAELPGGLGEARDGMERFGESIIVGMEKKISILAVLGTLGPMIGLLGTLMGMIKSFSVIATAGTNLDAGQVAGGISEALILTFEGVFLSVPSIYFYSFFKNRISVISTAVMLRADEFLRHFAHAARTKSAPAAARPMPPAAPVR
ncbi:MAG TPA: MotA/TolQ/ExbB proton channel family protein [Pirellulales bacterium]|nr:MotA/TolQ/ExbB proton channel family protein [Pirellulales bacterium]